jgi:hypothetical protein
MRIDKIASTWGIEPGAIVVAANDIGVTVSTYDSTIIGHRPYQVIPDDDVWTVLLQVQRRAVAAVERAWGSERGDR